MITGLDVLDTAVKVGLGALLSAGGAYLLAGRTNRTESARERTKRRRELFEIIAEAVMSFSHTFLIYWARSADIAAKRREGQEASEPAKERLFEARDNLFNAFAMLTSAEGKLLLLGEKEAQSRLRDLGDFAGQVRARTPLSDPPHTEAQYGEMRSTFGAKREAFFDGLAKVYAASVA